MNPLCLYCDCSAVTFDTCESESEKQIPASFRKSGLRIPLEQEALVWHITLCVVVHALGLQEIVEFIHHLELLVMCEGCRLLVEAPGGQSGIYWSAMCLQVGMSLCLVLGSSAIGSSTLKNKISLKFYTLCSALGLCPKPR